MNNRSMSWPTTYTLLSLGGLAVSIAGTFSALRILSQQGALDAFAKTQLGFAGLFGILAIWYAAQDLQTRGQKRERPSWILVVACLLVAILTGWMLTHFSSAING